MYRAGTVMEILSIGAELTAPNCKPWCLLWPCAPDRQIMIWDSKREAIDELVAGQISQFAAPAAGIAFTNGTWDAWSGTRVLELVASQFPWAQGTNVLAAAHHSLVPLALIGIAGPASTARAEILALEITRAIGNLAMVDHLRREAAMYRWLLESSNEAWIVGDETGQIIAGTRPGHDALRRAQYGDRRPPMKHPEPVIPTTILSAVQCGLSPAMHGISISGSPFGLENSELTEPLIALRFRSLDPSGTGVNADRVAEVLTPAQRDVHRLLAKGLRDKEIAQLLGISRHTVHHHANEVLRRLGFADRLELVAKSKLTQVNDSAA